MSENTAVDWNQLVDDDEQPSENHPIVTETLTDDESQDTSADVLDVHYDDDIQGISETESLVLSPVGKKKNDKKPAVQSDKTHGVLATKSHRRGKEKRPPTTTNSKRIGHRKIRAKTRQTQHLYRDSLPQRRFMSIRWMRHGYEHLVFDICNCNEAPNVVFTGLCYSQSDVYTMVLRNCDGKRRYWYDKATRHRQLCNGARVSDFERAMRWRANAVGRLSTSPGYDLAAFVLQNVATDGRCARVSSPTPPPQLILVTTDQMINHPEIYSQLVKSQTAGSFYQPPPPTCYVCRGVAGIATQDNASVPTFTCWQHSGSQMLDASADSTRVCNTVVIELQFLRGGDYSEFVCRVNMVVPKETRSVTIAELVFSPMGVDIAQEECHSQTVIDLETAHASTCRDRHYNVEDLFPSMPANSCHGTHYYDTKIGLIVDRMHCIANMFRK